MRVGVVAIGRNEGERLARCLRSASRAGAPVVYVDSQSTDSSVAIARTLGVSVVEIDASEPLTAARSRNAGFRRLIAEHPDLEAVQFVDGDCELVEGWLERASAELAQPGVGVVCGRRRERHPEQSIYNLLCDMEWDTPVGETTFCGGDALMRSEAFQQAGGFDARLIAGEEPELCVRLRQHGWRILRIDAEMTLHDAAIQRFSQWWRRSVRAGHAFTEGAHRHGGGPGRHWLWESLSIAAWGLALPCAAVLAGLASGGPGWLLLGAYPLQVVRIYRSGARPGFPRRARWLYAGACVLGKIPQAWGQIGYVTSRLRGRRTRLIEYKGAS